ncbi:F-box protein At5g07610-like [Solanum dulcamara]|uniref:F-box protein At5g07610-like n=1 Tax=Solanum dulcamara TaxID=45834 RepID=UPI002485D888|nr:F-box protein At5g07610-like [Solanum dulcamara]
MDSAVIFIQTFNMSYSAEKIEGSDDLLTKILLLLPARPLFRFKLVSKRWMSLVSDPRFSSLWKPESFPTAFILQSPFLDYPCYYLPDKTKSKASIIFFDFIKDVVILNCCGGLLLCRKRLYDKYIVCNPTTKEFHTLPSPNVESLNMSLAFDHSISPHYKVINVGYLGHGKGVFFNGAIFWIFRGINSFCYFDIDREIIHSYQLPKWLNSITVDASVGIYILLALDSVIRIILTYLYWEMTTTLGA